VTVTLFFPFSKPDNQPSAAAVVIFSSQQRGNFILLYFILLPHSANGASKKTKNNRTESNNLAFSNEGLGYEEVRVKGLLFIETHIHDLEIHNNQ